MSIQFDDRQLQQLYQELDPKRRLQALRKGFKREAERVRKAAVKNLRGSVSSNRDLEGGIRAWVWKKKGAGFTVSIGSKAMKARNKGKRKNVQRVGKARVVWTGFAMHTNKQGKEKPVLIWVEGGTKVRQSKSPTRYQVAGVWKTGNKRGIMQAYGFMEKTLKEERDKVTDNIHREVISAVEETAKKYGCK